MEVYISKPITISSTETLRQNKGKEGARHISSANKLSEYGTSECCRPLSQFSPNQALEHKWQQQGITPCYDEDPVLIFKVELHPTKSISAHLQGEKKHNCMCTSACIYTLSSTERAYIQRVWILKLHSLKAEINL
jgi:hypothetical protein